MKGIILTEFIEYIEQRLGDDTTQCIIDDSKLKSGGVYTRVGLYDYQDLIQLLTQTVSETKVEAGALLEGFSDHLFGVFKRDYSVFFDDVGSAAEMLSQIDNHIHVEVQKLYPDAELPSFDFQDMGEFVVLNYKSPRPLAAVARSLVGACLKYFGDQEELVESKIAEDQKSASFTIQVIKAV
ncbi:MAG: hypothetical protein ACI9FR_000448 [Cryomorphaceae bacterium]|jgi:hypothetical protein